MSHHLDLGRRGEILAASHLISLRYRILGRNVRCGREEIDIVAFDPVHGMVVFVEVKTRSRTSSAYPVRTAVDARKRRCLSKAVSQWVIEHGYEGPARIDLLCVCGTRIVEHIMDLGSDFF